MNNYLKFIDWSFKKKYCKIKWVEILILFILQVNKRMYGSLYILNMIKKYIDKSKYEYINTHNIKNSRMNVEKR